MVEQTFYTGVAMLAVGGVLTLLNCKYGPAGIIAGSILLGVYLLLCCTEAVFAHDDGRYANSPLREWFNGLKSKRGPCCSDSDGKVVADADWTRLNGHVLVRVPATKDSNDATVWVDVPPEAEITEPNRAGRTMVWPLYLTDGIKIRCFMPGTMG